EFAAVSTRSCAALPPSSDLAVNCGDPEEIRGFQAGAADQRAVNVGGGQQFPGIGGFYRAAVEDANASALATEALAERSADEPVDIGHVLNGRRQAGADRPD